eukprot:548435-Pyramimonas_sp.AAC.1
MMVFWTCDRCKHGARYPGADMRVTPVHTRAEGCIFKDTVAPSRAVVGAPPAVPAPAQAPAPVPAPAPAPAPVPLPEAPPPLAKAEPPPISGSKQDDGPASASAPLEPNPAPHAAPARPLDD